MNQPVATVSQELAPRPRRPAADTVARRLLFVPDEPRASSEQGAYSLFSTSMLLSALRCLLGYVVLPIITPLLGAATGFTPVVGIPVAAVALVFDVRGIRRFWLANHRWRWPISGIYLAVMGLVLALLVTGILKLVS